MNVSSEDPLQKMLTLKQGRIKYGLGILDCINFKFDVKIYKHKSEPDDQIFTNTLNFYRVSEKTKVAYLNFLIDFKNIKVCFKDYLFNLNIEGKD